MAWAWTGAERTERTERTERRRIEFPEILGIHLLEVVLELVGLERRIGRGLVGFHSALVEELVAGEYRGPHAEGQRNAVRGAGVDLKDMIVPPDQKLGEVGVLLDRADDHPPKVSPQTNQNLLQEIVGERALRLHALQLHGDGAGLRRPDPDGQNS